MTDQAPAMTKEAARSVVDHYAPLAEASAKTFVDKYLQRYSDPNSTAVPRRERQQYAESMHVINQLAAARSALAQP